MQKYPSQKTSFRMMLFHKTLIIMIRNCNVNNIQLLFIFAEESVIISACLLSLSFNTLISLLSD